MAQTRSTGSCALSWSISAYARARPTSRVYWSSHFGHGFIGTPVPLLSRIGRQPGVMCMRTELTVLPDHILRDALFRFVERCVTDFGDSFRFQASEEALHWTVVPTVAAPTHALHHLIPPQLLPERQAGVLATLIGME